MPGRRASGSRISMLLTKDRSGSGWLGAGAGQVPPGGVALLDRRDAYALASEGGNHPGNRALRRSEMPAEAVSEGIRRGVETAGPRKLSRPRDGPGHT
jgi:hypothetical protein